MSSAAASATLTAVPAMSCELSLDALLIANSGRPGSSSARGPTTSQPLSLGSRHPLPGEGLLNTTTRQSSAPDTPNLSARYSPYSIPLPSYCRRLASFADSIDTLHVTQQQYPSL